MSVITTNVISNLPVAGVRPIAQSVVKFVNNDSVNTGKAYILGSNLTSTKATFSQEIITLTPNQVATRTFNPNFDYFQLDFVTSLDEVDVQVFGVSSTNATTRLPLATLPIRRITSNFRSDITVTSSDSAAISFRKKTDFISPAQSASTILPEGLEILSKMPIRYKVILGGTVDGAFVNFPTPTTQLDSAQTALQVNFTCTSVSGGQVIFQGTGSGLSAANFLARVNLINEQLRTDVPEPSPVTLVVSSLAGGDTVSATFSMLEEW